MSDPITFDELQTSRRDPGTKIELRTRNAVRGLPGNQQHEVILAQRLSTGTIAAATPVDVYSADEAAEYAGRGSVAHLMAKAAIKANKYVALTLCLLEDASAGAARVDTVTISGPATGPGTGVLSIGDDDIEIAISTDDTAADIASILKTEAAKYPDMLFTATVADAVITLTCRHKGTVGNQVDIVAEFTAAGVSAVVATATSGATDPDIQDALDAVAGETYELYATHLNDADSAQALAEHIESISDGNSMRGCRGVLGIDDTLTNAATLQAGINNGRVALCLSRGTSSPAYEIAAACASVETAPKYEDPAVPRRNMTVLGISAPEISDRFTDGEITTMLNSGITPLVVNSSGKVEILRFISTYTTNDEGVEVSTLLDFNTMAELDYGRKAIRQVLSTKFSESKATERTRKAVRSEIYATMLKLDEAEIWQNVEVNKDGLVVIVDEDEPTRFRFRCPADVVKGLHQLYGVIDMIA